MLLCISVTYLLNIFWDRILRGSDLPRWYLSYTRIQPQRVWLLNAMCPVLNNYLELLMYVTVTSNIVAV
jgi:hypothetical protein